MSNRPTKLRTLRRLRLVILKEVVLLEEKRQKEVIAEPAVNNVVKWSVGVWTDYDPSCLESSPDHL